MKNPKSKYVSSVRKVMKTRQLRIIIILSLCIVFALIALLIIYMSFLKEDIDRTFADHAAESSMPAPDIGESSRPDITDDLNMLEEDTQATDEYASELDIDLTGYGFFEETEHFVFDTDLVLQTVTYGERSIAFAQLKNNVRQFIDNESRARISIYYINLFNNESFGFNDLSPFVFASTMNLPINLVLYDRILQGDVEPTDLVHYSGPSHSDTYSLIDTFFSNLDNQPEPTPSEATNNEDEDVEENEDVEEDEGVEEDIDKPRYLSIRELSYLSIVHSDATATEMLINHLGGIESINDDLLSISGAVNFLSVRNYPDFQGVQHSGTHRSSAYDMAHYAEYLYYQYRMHPHTYQSLINDLSRSEPDWGISDGLAPHINTLNKNGINTALSSVSDLAFVIGEEPYILCVVVESSSTANSQRIIRNISEMFNDYFEYCFS